MITLVPRNIIQTSTQLQEEQDRILEEARIKNEEKKREKQAAFKSTFAKKITSESTTNISNDGEDMNSDKSVNQPNTKDELAGRNNQKPEGNSDSSTIDTSMPLVEALRKHFEMN